MSELKTERVPIMFEPRLLKEVDDYRFANRIDSRSKAVRRLIEVGLSEFNETQKADAEFSRP